MILSVFVLIFLIVPSVSEAYLDPGTTSMFFQILLSALVGAFVTTRIFWGRFVTYKILRRFYSLPENDRSIVFYAETKADWVHFAPIIEELTQSKNQKICYVTSDKDDPVLKTANSNIASFAIGNGALCTFFFRTLEARVMVLTMTDLDSFHLKRSKVAPVHYVYVFHSLTSSHMGFRKYAHAAYDTVLCAGPHHFEELRKSEAVFGFKKKNLIQAGYGRLDSLLKEAKSRPQFVPSPGVSKRILIAPSWGKNSITNTCIFELVDILLSAGHYVTYRPHPMSLLHDSNLVPDLKKKFSSNQNFNLETDVRLTESLHNSDIMVSDGSGAALEYAFGLERPVLFVDTPRKVNNKDYEALEIEPIEIKIRKDIGGVISPNNLQEAASMIEKLCAQTSLYPKKLADLRAKWIYKVGASGEVGASVILDAAQKGRDLSNGA